MLNPYEENIRLLLSKYLSIEITPVDNDPPDCHVHIDGNVILLEITSIHDIYYDQALIKGRKTLDNALINMLDTLNKKYISQIPNDISFCFYITGPINDFRKFKNQLEGFICELMVDYGKYASDRFIDYNLNDEKIKFIITKRRNKAIWGLVGVKNENTEYCLNDQMELCLKYAVNDKTNKMKDFQGIKWLAIDCKQELSDYELCKISINNITDYGCFSKIFFIYEDSIIEKSR